MRKVGLVFILAVILPSLVLAWLAVRSLRDQQFVIERQQSLLCQGVADGLAEQIAGRLAERQLEFSTEVERLIQGQSPREFADRFDARIRQEWPLAEVGFAVNLFGNLLCPSPSSSQQALFFCRDNSGFLANQEIAEVYGNVAYNNSVNPEAKNVFQTLNSPPSEAQAQYQDNSSFWSRGNTQVQQAPLNVVNLGKAQNRKVNPVQQIAAQQQAEAPFPDQNYSKNIPAEAGFAELVGEGTDGMLARFLQNQLKVMFWHRASADPNIVFGAQLNLPQLTADLRELVHVDRLFHNDICIALLDDNARPVALSREGFQTDWKRPFVASEVSEALPHWEVGVYLLNPDRLAQAAHTTKLTLGLLILLLVLAISVGSWLIVTDVNRQLRLTRQKTDFVSNVSHELKTPLTSIRMFSEMLAEDKVSDRDKQRSYLRIIAAESGRLTRLINNVLDFARLDRGEKTYEHKNFDLGEWLEETIQTYRPHLEADGFGLEFEKPRDVLTVRGDRDALSQVLVNLLSNAEKYSNGSRKIALRTQLQSEPVRHVEIQVLDRGRGVPRGCEQKIFEQFFRVDDSLNSGVQGSGLGLTLARQIARAHGGDVTYRPRAGGGSCFTLSLPVHSTADGNR